MCVRGSLLRRNIAQKHVGKASPEPDTALHWERRTGPWEPLCRDRLENSLIPLQASVSTSPIRACTLQAPSGPGFRAGAEGREGASEQGGHGETSGELRDKPAGQPDPRPLGLSSQGPGKGQDRAKVWLLALFPAYFGVCGPGPGDRRRVPGGCPRSTHSKANTHNRKERSDRGCEVQVAGAARNQAARKENGPESGFDTGGTGSH